MLVARPSVPTGDHERSSCRTAGGSLESTGTSLDSACTSSRDGSDAVPEFIVVRDGSIVLVIRGGAASDAACSESSRAVDALVTVPSNASGTVSVRPMVGGPSGMHDQELEQLAMDLRDQVKTCAGLSVAAVGDRLQDYLERRNMESWDDEEEMMVHYLDIILQLSPSSTPHLAGAACIIMQYGRLALRLNAHFNTLAGAGQNGRLR